MPGNEVYAVDLRDGLDPYKDVHGWGRLEIGNANAGNNIDSYRDHYGRHMTMERKASDPLLATNSLYVLPPAQSAVSITSRLMMRVEFDRPHAESFPSQGGGNRGVAGRVLYPEAWGVGLAYKFGNQNDVDGQPMVSVTCQFNRQFNGVRINAPNADQTDKQTPLDTPLDYDQYNPPAWSDFLGWIPPIEPFHLQFPSGPQRFVLDHYYAGNNIGSLGHSAGFGTLSIGGPGFWRTNERAFSHKGLVTSNQQQNIDAFGVSLVTRDGVGKYHIRLRKFSVFEWVPVT